MMGVDFLLSAIGIPKEEVEALKSFLEPDRIKHVAADLLARFEAMETRNIEMHAAVLAMSSGATNPEDGVLHAEMNRQTALFESGAHLQERMLEHG